MNFEEDMKIDEDSLDSECIKQPNLYMQYAEKTANAERMLNDAKLTLDILKANTDSAIRAKAKEAGEKITEAVVANRITVDEECIKQTEIVNLYKRDYSVMQSAVKAMDHKKSMINNLVTLWVGSYYSTPTHKKEVIEKGNNKMQDEIRTKMNQKGEN